MRLRGYAIVRGTQGARQLVTVPQFCQCVVGQARKRLAMRSEVSNVAEGNR